MRKVFSRFVLWGFSSIVLLVMAGCQGAGLGAAVDTEAPTLTIDYPPDAAVIKDWFYIAGTCSDDKTVKSVQIRLINSNLEGIEYGPFEAELSEDNKSWHLKMNEPLDSEGYNCFTYPDGKYTVSIFAYDGAGRSSGEASRSYVLDNAAPFMIIKSPGIDAAESIPAIGEEGKSPSAYGANFKIVGTIVEENDVALLEVDVYNADDGGFDDNGPRTALQPTVETLKFSNINIAGGTEELIASCNDTQSELLQSYYKSIYGESRTDDGKLINETKNFYCKLTLTDGAKIYQDINGKEIKDEGNKTSDVYINDLISDSLMTITETNPEYEFSAKQIAQILNDSWVLFPSQKNNKFEYTDENIKTVKEIAKKSISNLTAFSLNPDASPKYSVSGYGYSIENGKEDEIAQATIDQSLTISVKAGRDGWYIKPEKLVYYLFGPYDTLNKDTINEIYNNPKAYAAANESFVKKMISNAYDEETGTGYNGSTLETYNFEVKTPEESVMAKRYYIIALSGEDAKGNAMMPDDGKYFLFVGSSNNLPPTLTVDQTTNSYFNTTDINITGTSSSKLGKEIKSVYWVATITDPADSNNLWSYDYDVKNDAEATPELTGTIITDGEGLSSSNIRWTFNLNDFKNAVEDFKKISREDGRVYNVSFQVWSEDVDGAESARIERSIIIDTKAPSFSISDMAVVNGAVQSYVGENDLNFKKTAEGEFKYTLQGSLTDEGQGVESYYIKVLEGSDAGTVSGIVRPELSDTTGWTKYDETSVKQVIDVGSDYSKKTIAFFAVDRQGNRSQLYTYPIAFDYYAPEVEITKPTSNYIIKKGEEFEVTAKINEKEIKSVSLYDGSDLLATYPDDGDAETSTLTLRADSSTPGLYTFSHSVQSPSEHSYKFKVIVDDFTERGASSSEIIASYDKTPPSINITDIGFFDNALILGDENSNVRRNGSEFTYTLALELSDYVGGSTTNEGSGISELWYSWDGAPFEKFKGTFTGITSTTETTVSLPITEGKGKALAIKVIDRAKNETIKEISGIAFDYDAPKIEITSQVPKYVGKEESLIIDATAKDSYKLLAAGVDVKAFKKDSGNWVEFTLGDSLEKSQDSENTNDVGIGIKFENLTNAATYEGEWKFEIEATDENGRSTKIETSEITIDLTPPAISTFKLAGITPTGTGFKDGTEDKIFGSTTLKPYIEFTENTSGMKSIKYSVKNGSNTAEQESSQTTNVYDRNFSGFKDGDNELSIILTDNAGNTFTTKTPYIVKVDTNAPVVALEPFKDADGNDITTGSGTIYFTATIDEGSKLESAYLRYYDSTGKNKLEAYDTQIDLDKENDSHEKYLTKTTDGYVLTKYPIDVSGLPNNQYRILLEVTDIAKQTGSSGKQNLLVDKKQPEITEINIANNEKIVGERDDKLSVSSDGTSATLMLEGKWCDVGDNYDTTGAIGSGTDALYYTWGGRNRRS